MNINATTGVRFGLIHKLLGRSNQPITLQNNKRLSKYYEAAQRNISAKMADEKTHHTVIRPTEFFPDLHDSVQQELKRLVKRFKFSGEHALRISPAGEVVVIQDQCPQSQFLANLISLERGDGFRSRPFSRHPIRSNTLSDKINRGDDISLNITS